MSSPAPIIFYNRETQSLEEEAIYGEGFLRWIYESAPGRLALETVVKRRAFSAWYGWRMDRPGSREKIKPFIEEYGLDAEEFADPVASFKTFNDFFYRHLKSSARPIDPRDEHVVFPADGRHLAIPDLAASEGFFVKGQRFNLAALLGDAELGAQFEGGTLVLSRLCPVDYHRFHFPCAGEAAAPQILNGPLYSVNPIALRQNLAYLWENRRSCTLLETSAGGKVASIDVGATCVGGIEHTYTPGPVEKGAAKGYFKFGGSSTITLFQRGAVTLADDLLEQSSQQRELYAKMGETLGSWSES